RLDTVIYCFHSVKRRSLVLLWRPPWGLSSEGRNEGFRAGECEMTYNRSRIAEAGAVVFHYSGLDQEDMPWKHYRDAAQYFVFTSMESPSYVMHGEHRALSKFDGGFINWTMTYRSDGDVFSPYIESKVAIPVFQRNQTWLNSTLVTKSKIALWVVSNCDLLRGSRLRMDYVTKLVEAGLPVDRYGKCFNNKEEFSKMSSEDLSSYKFYFSFENAEHCKDYMTEKFWRSGIEYGRVPVVWGPRKTDVEHLAPPGSFIHVEDFESPAKLAAYLLYLDKNDTAYREYFKWVEHPGEGMALIKELYSRTREEVLCDKLLSNPSPNIVESVTDFFYKSEPKECLAND
uniref:Fucosyltransferase n=1 Tax=Ciona savignyi TaxID=51511 RepID=H2Y8W9_CIOSA